MWIGWFPRPVPVGLPVAGVVVTRVDDLVLPLSPGAPWLFGFATARHAAPEHLLIPSRPVVAAHPAPVIGPGEVTLVFDSAGPESLPLLPALPALLPRSPKQRNFGQTFDRGAA